MPAVFYRLRRAAAYAGHAVGAAIAPNGPSAIDADVLRRAQSGALSAADAGVACAEFLGLDKHRVKRAVYDAAAYSVCELYRRHGFTNDKLFHRLFRERFHTTPLQLRKAAREKGS